MGDTQVVVRTIDPDREMDAFTATIMAAFGLRPEPGEVERRRRFVEPGRTWMAEIGGEPVGTSRTFASELTLPGGGVVPAGALTAVGVLPTA